MSFLPPNEIAKSASAIGEKKGKMTTGKIILPGILAGAYIAFAAVACLTIGSGWVGDWAASGLNKAAGAAAFTVGLIMVVVAGAELFTGNNMYVAMSLFDGKTTAPQLLRNWVVVFISNFVGSLIIVAIIYWGGFLFQDGQLTAFGTKAVATATSKASLDWGAAFLRGVGCNWLVCLAVWMAIGAQDVIGKIFACFFPIFTFVLCGFEHSVANMFFIPLGVVAAQGSVDVLTVANFFTANLIPVTLGNIVGGAIFVAMFYYFTHLHAEKKAEKTKTTSA
ncbi:MAG: formate/nitrite transporter family protein [Bacillota bacterium]|nr:formate/nitrite transporter family protein [Bacillota bacterium]